MHDTSVRTSPPSRLDPALSWTVLTDAPLQGLALAREAGLILAWDETAQLYVLDLNGERLATARAPDQVAAGAISDNGSLIALLGKGGKLWMLSPDLELLVDRAAPPDSLALAVDPHGRYVAVSSKLSFTQFLSRHGRPAGKFETKQALAHLCFIPSQPLLVATAAYGTMVGVDLAPVGPGQIDAEEIWSFALMSNVGRLTTTGDGGMILASCFTHGVQRYDLRGHNEGSYHLGGTASHAVPDFAGRSIAVATLEGELAILSGAGNVRWRTSLARGANALEFDALGRFLIYGLPTGEMSRIDLDGSTAPKRPASRPRKAVLSAQSGISHGIGPLRTPAWTAQVAQTDEQAETAVLAILDDPARLAFLTGKNRLQVFDTGGTHLGQGPEVAGVGRLLRTSPGWIAGATDRNVMLYDALRNTLKRIDFSIVEMTHLAIRPDTYGLAVVQERDRIGRATITGDWVWKTELKTGIEDVAIGPDETTAFTTDDGKLIIYDASGEAYGSFTLDGSEPLLLVEAPRGHTGPRNLAWITMARRSQTLMGHDLAGRVLWQVALPWEGWQIHPLGPLVVVTSANGRAQAWDCAGRLRSQSRAGAAGDPQAVYCFGTSGQAWSISRQGVHVICSELGGQVVWRAVVDGPLGPIAASALGVAVMIGRSLAWFPAPEPT